MELFLFDSILTNLPKHNIIYYGDNMYNFNISVKKQKELLDACNFSDVETSIFKALVNDVKRKDIPILLKGKYNISGRTVYRKINNIIEKISNSNVILEENIKHKIYIHKFPNGKKYVGVCQSIDDRWNNGFGYMNNPEMFKAIQKYGWDNIEHKILFETEDNYIAYKLEKILIEELDLINNGYNNM